MNANQSPAGVPRCQRPPVRSAGVRRPLSPMPRDRSVTSEYGDAPFFPSVIIALVILVVIFWMGIVDAGSAESPAARIAAPAVVQMKDVDTPGLMLRSRQPGYFVAAPMVASDIDVEISAAVARTTVTQRFRNPSDSWVEGVYVFPLPDGAAVDTLKMIVGDRAIEGRIKERKAARAVYEQARGEGKKAALVEQERPNMFTNSIANVGPNETVVIQIEFQQEVTIRDGVASLRIPLVPAPRYAPPRDRHMVAGAVSQPALAAVVPDRERPGFPVRHPAAGSRNPVSLTVTLDAGFPIDRIASSYQRVRINQTAGQTATLTLEDGEVPADRDFELTWTARAEAEPTASLFHESSHGADYLLAVVAPPLPSGSAHPGRPAREVIFVIDNSGSMAGASMRQAKAGLDLALRRLAPRDRFNLIRFDNSTETLFPAAVDATPENVARARDFVARLEADGGTEMLPALRAALADARPAERSRLRQVVFITDGAIGNEEQLFDEIVRNRGRSRIFTVGIGSAPNSFFMTRAAMAGRGTFTLIGSADQVAGRMEALFHKLEHPAVTDLEALWSDGAQVESWPNPLPDLYAGEPIVIAARASGPKGSLTLRGRIGNERWHTEIRLDQASEGSGIAKLWARRKIMALEGRRYGSDNAGLFDREILKTALDHKLVSRLTSLVAVDVTPSRRAGTPLVQKDVPLDLPAGWKFDKVFGPDTETRDAGLNHMLADRYSALLMPAPDHSAPDAIAQTKRGIDLPEGATPADRRMLIGLLSIAFAAMIAMATIAGRRALSLLQPPSTSR